MAQCERCGRVPLSGQNRPFSLKATKRKFHINVQRTTLRRQGMKRKVYLCSRCLRTLVKTVSD